MSRFGKSPSDSNLATVRTDRGHLASAAQKMCACVVIRVFQAEKYEVHCYTSAACKSSGDASPSVAEWSADLVVDG